MSEWTVVGVLVTLAGLFAAVGAPVLKLNGTIARLQTLLDQMRGELNDLKDRSRQTHRRLWEKSEQQDRLIADHEGRLTSLEAKEREDAD